MNAVENTKPGVCPTCLRGYEWSSSRVRVTITPKGKAVLARIKEGR